MVNQYNNFKHLEAQGKYSVWKTIEDSENRTNINYLGSVATQYLLPLEASDAVLIWDLPKNPIPGNIAFVEVDSDHNDNTSQYIIKSIKDGILTWEYQYSIPIPTGDYQRLDNLATTWTSITDLLYPSVKAVENRVSDIHGLIPSGAMGQALFKRTNQDYDTEWGDIPAPRPTAITSNDFTVGGTGFAKTINITEGGLLSSQLADDIITNDKLVDDCVSTSKLQNKSVTVGKIDSGVNNQVLRTNGNNVEWSNEIDISGKADIFSYNDHTYNLDAIKGFKIEGNGGGIAPNTGITFTDFAGDSVTIDIESDSGFFNYVGQVATFERLPSLADPNIHDGDIYSIYGPINYLGTIDVLPTNLTSANDLTQYRLNSDNQYYYWSQPTPASVGQWVVNHCQLQTGCDTQGYYAFGVNDEPNWNRIDADINIDKELNADSLNAVSNMATTNGIMTKVDTDEFIETIQYCIDEYFPYYSVEE